MSVMIERCDVSPLPPEVTRMLRCPISGESLSWQGGCLVSDSGTHRYRISPQGIPLFAEKFCSPDGRAQQAHYERIAKAYVRNLSQPQTVEYSAYLDRALLEEIRESDLGVVAEICCGRGEAFRLMAGRIRLGIGVDVSESMLNTARRDLPRGRFAFLQADAVKLPLKDAQMDCVVMVGGVHHVPERRQLFAEVFRILKPGGRFLWREPVSDFLPWRAIRSAIYRLSPTLDHETERPLLYRETVPLLVEVGFRPLAWKTVGFLGFCVLMNSDVLKVNRVLRFVPGIRGFSRFMARFDEFVLRLPGLTGAGLQVIGSAERP